VPKPIRVEELFAAIDRVRAPKRGPAPSTRKAPEAPHSEMLDLPAALERVEGDRGLLAELMRLFADQCPGTMVEIRHAFEGRDAQVLERLAHSMKGTAASLAAGEVSETASHLQEQAHAGDWEKVRASIQSLQEEIDQLLPEMESLCKKAGP